MGTDDRPLFSVIIPTHNHAAQLPRLFASLDAQTCDSYEIVVIDDGSGDETPEVLARYANDRIRWHSQSCAGPWSARNRGAELARSNWLIFLDDDDDVTPDWIETHARLIGPDVGLASCAVVIVDASGNEVDRWTPQPMGRLFDGAAAVFLPGAFGVRRDVFKEAGGYDTLVTFGENYELGIRLVKTCRDLGLRCVSTPSTPLRHVTRPPHERASADPRKQLDGAERMLAKHAAALRDDRNWLLNILAIAGVNTARVGDWPRARRHLTHAVALRPFRAKAWGRAFGAWVPPVGRRLWQTS